MIREDLGVYLAVISHARPGNVQKMQAMVGEATWYVGAGERQAYRQEGATAVVESGGLCPSRNAALKDAWAFGVPCIELSDDLRKLQMAVPQEGKNRAVDISFEEAVSTMLEASRLYTAKLAGVAPTANAFYYNPNRPFHHRAFIVGDLILVRPCALLFDERLKLKEDYDYTLAHLSKYHVVARCNGVLATFAHRQNKGGAVDFRTPAREQEAIAILREKWGAAIKDNPRRPNEILLNLR